MLKNILILLASLFKPKPKKTNLKLAMEMPMPINKGRSSIDNNEKYLNSDVALDPEFSLDWLPVINQQAIFHHDVSRAVNNLITLANTEYEIYFDDNVSERQAVKMRAYLKEVEKGWFDYSASELTLNNSLFRQLAVFGTISAEMEIMPNLKGIKKIITVNPEEIRFILKNGDYYPYQQVWNLSGTNALGLKQLNTTTYKYIPIEKANQTPYAIPPFLGAMKILGIEINAISNIDNIIDKYGVMGLLEALLTPPERYEDESDEDYTKRCVTYIESVAPTIKESLSKGYVVGFKGSHEFKLSGNQINANGVEKMMNVIDDMKMSGLKQDPNMFGRHTTVTETFGRVLLSLLITQATQYQKAVAEFMSKARLIALQMAGFKVQYVKTEFKTPLPTDKLKDEQARSAQIDNLIKLYNQGVISQTQFAQELGYDKPALDTPSIPIPNDTMPIPTLDPNTQTVSNRLTLALAKVKLGLPYYDYTIPESYQDNYGRTDWNDSVTQSFADNYLDSIEEKYSEAISKVSDKVGEVLSKLPANSTNNTVQANVLLSLFENWTAYFTDTIKTNVKRNVKNMYSHFRGDKTIFGETKKDSNTQSFDSPPIPKLDQIDKRAIEWLQNHDIAFLGKFITDKDTQNRIKAFIQKFFESGQSIDETVINDFKKEFENVLQGEDWKIRRILDTSINRIRAYANIQYISQANVSQFKVVEIMDRITCPHCQAMNGRTFEVSTAKAKIEKVVSSEFEDIGKVSPFATTIDASVLASMTDTQIQALGIDTTPFHPSCRGRIVAVI